MNKSNSSSRPARIFVAYARQDASLKDELLRHLSCLRNQGRLVHWDDHDIGLGQEWDGEIGRRIEEADVILLLLSQHFFASDYIGSQEIPRALVRHRAGRAVVVPVLVRDCHWQGSALGVLQGLPRDGKGIAGRHNRDRAFAEVAKEVDRLVRALVDRDKSPRLHQEAANKRVQQTARSLGGGR